MNAVEPKEIEVSSLNMDYAVSIGIFLNQEEYFFVYCIRFGTKI